VPITSPFSDSLAALRSSQPERRWEAKAIVGLAAASCAGYRPQCRFPREIGTYSIAWSPFLFGERIEQAGVRGASRRPTRRWQRRLYDRILSSFEGARNDVKGHYSDGEG
jgi:hypothetical protein